MTSCRRAAPMGHVEACGGRAGTHPCPCTKARTGRFGAQDPECRRERGPLCGSLCRNNEGKEALMAEPVSNKGKFIQRFPEEPQCLLVLKQKHHVPACGLPLTDAGGWRDPARGRGGGGSPGGRSCRGGAFCRVPPTHCCFLLSVLGGLAHSPLNRSGLRPWSSGASPRSHGITLPEARPSWSALCSSALRGPLWFSG